MLEFPDRLKRGVYEAIWRRRDMRDFLPHSVDTRVLARVLSAAHHAGSVGFMQPWRFLIVDDTRIRRSIHEHVTSQRVAAAEVYEAERKAAYLSLKLEGILEAPVNLCVVCDTSRHEPPVLGRQTIRETDTYSTCCAIQNLWLAARAEGIGVGWVSLLQPAYLKQVLALPEYIEPVAYLCLGYVKQFPDLPSLEQSRWASRRRLSELVHGSVWGSSASPDVLEAIAAIEGQSLMDYFGAGG